MKFSIKYIKLPIAQRESNTPYINEKKLLRKKIFTGAKSGLEGDFDSVAKLCTVVIKHPYSGDFGFNLHFGLLYIFKSLKYAGRVFVHFPKLVEYFFIFYYGKLVVYSYILYC